MNTIKYHKRVRDKIPELIEKEGKQSVCSVLSDEEYLEFLDRKLSEELEEYLEDKSMEELADLLEVMMAVAKARGSSIEEVEKSGGRKLPNGAALKRRSFWRKYAPYDGNL